MKLHNCLIILLGEESCLHSVETDDFKGNILVGKTDLSAEQVTTVKKLFEAFSMEEMK